jgi:hypothetical protein
VPPESSHLRDSRLYGQNWAVEPVRSWFTESRRIASWLEILAAITHAQADLDRIAERSHATGHSTTGLLEVVDDQAHRGVP